MSAPHCTPYLWTMQNGTKIAVPEMTTLHLFHSLRMLWNHTMPEAQQLKPFRYWNLVSEWSAEDRMEAADAFREELAKRPAENLTREQHAELETMQRGWPAFRAELDRIDQEQADDLTEELSMREIMGDWL